MPAPVSNLLLVIPSELIPPVPPVPSAAEGSAAEGSAAEGSIAEGSEVEGRSDDLFSEGLP